MYTHTLKCPTHHRLCTLAQCFYQGRGWKSEQQKQHWRHEAYVMFKFNKVGGKKCSPKFVSHICGEESGSHSAVYNALWWIEGDGTQKLSGNVQINTFHQNWQLMDQVSFQQVLTFKQLRHEESSCRSSHVIISWPCLLDGLPPFFTAIKLAMAVMIINRYNQPSTTTAPLLSKEAPVHLNEGCNDCNANQDRMLAFGLLQHFASQVGRELSGLWKPYFNELKFFRCVD